MNRLAPFLAFARNTLTRPKFQVAVLIGAIAAAGSAHLAAQQPYPYPAQPEAPDAYGQYAAPGQSYGDPQYGEQQYAQPQYAGPRYGQQQYPQPQYTQPQYAQQPPEQPAYPGPNADPYPELDQMQPEQGNQQAQPPLNADQLEQLVAPIALYPDALLAQILTASTYPAQVSIAAQWLQQMRAQGYGTPAMVASGADAQADWDPSIKALTAFPQVLDTLNQNLQWTTALGNAYYNQPDDVMQTVQVLRERAAAAGNLQSTPQESVSNDEGNIEIAPDNPQMVYVPTYNPWEVYGQPIPPYSGFSFDGALGSFFGGPVEYGLGFALSAFEQFPWGFLGWDFDWRSHDVLYGRGAYFTHSRSVADWGFPHGGPRAYGGRGESARFSNGDRGARAWNRGSNGYDRGQSFNRGERPGQSFNRGEQSYGRSEQQFGRPFQNQVRPAEPYAGRPQPFGQPSRGAYTNQPGNELNRGYSSPGNSYTRPAMPSQQAYNHMPPSYGRPQPYAGVQAYGRSPYTYGYGNRSAQPFAARPGGSSYPFYRAPQSAPPRSIAQAPSRSFSPFSRGSEQRNYGGSFGGGNHAPKGFSGSSSRSYGGGGSHFGGGGGGHFNAPKASNFGGEGGHSGGGGGHSGGGRHGR